MSGEGKDGRESVMARSKLCSRRFEAAIIEAGMEGIRLEHFMVPGLFSSEILHGLLSELIVFVGVLV